MADQTHTLAQVAAELVAAGLPKYDHDPASSEWRPPGPNCWWVHLPPAGLPAGDEAPMALLCGEGITDGHEWRFAVESCSCCDRIAQVLPMNHDGEPLAALPWWPGLPQLIKLHRQLSELWLAELARA